MASTVDIMNLALTKIGAAQISDPLQEDKSASVMSAIFDSCRDAELAAHPWSFAITRAQLPALTNAPSFDWARAFPLPVGNSACLRLVEVGGRWVFTTRCDEFEVEGGAILTDMGSPLKVRYVQRLTNTGLFPPLFVQALACRLAAEGAESITQSIAKRQQAWSEYKEALQIAKRVNAIERPPQSVTPTTWELAAGGY